jgi:hypothetical protein
MTHTSKITTLKRLKDHDIYGMYHRLYPTHSQHIIMKTAFNNIFIVNSLSITFISLWMFIIEKWV